MLQIENLYKKYENSDDIFELRIDLEVQNSSFVVITGESGSGKSTFAKILSGIISMDQGAIKFDNEDITRNLKSYVEYLEADEPLIGNFTVYQTLYAKCYHLYPLDEVEQKIDAICSSLKLTNLKTQKIVDLSGGEAQRVAVGCTLLSAKPIIVLDEATHSLDKNNSEIIISLLKETKNKTIIYITHKLEETNAIGDVYLHMQKGSIVNQNVVNVKEDVQANVSTVNHTKTLTLLKFNFLVGFKEHLLTILSYLLLFFLCSCFLAIGSFVTSANNEAITGLYNRVYYDGSDQNHDGICGDSTKYNVEVHSSFSHPIYSNEIEELKKIFKPVGAIENISVNSYEMLPDKDLNGTYSLKIAPLNSNDILSGRLYQSEKEIVIMVGETKYVTEQKYFDSLIGQYYGEYKVVGIIKSPHDTMDWFSTNYYASPKDFETYLSTHPIQNKYFFFSISEGKNTIFSTEDKADFMNCFIDNSLPDDVIATKVAPISKELEIYYKESFKQYTLTLKCIPSTEHQLSMNEKTFQKFTDEKAIDCTRFYFNTFKECQKFISYLNSEGIAYSMFYFQYNYKIQIICNIVAILLILVFYFIIGILNWKINYIRDLFYSKCGYQKKKLVISKVITSSVMVCISILLYALVYYGLSQLKCVSVVTYYALRWITLETGLILAAVALVLHIPIDVILVSLPRKKLRR
ncbi:MAG: ABC transporter ATP-binding protein [Roseburia sp.]|nr:ABC transporter ATP-binding protein [Anaeroplasma bactoclasticum]MCM1196952.1 ABC transporter ATP-binding protein [Roseburia sp.]